jgi:hypothetical protein
VSGDQLRVAVRCARSVASRSCPELRLYERIAFSAYFLWLSVLAVAGRKDSLSESAELAKTERMGSPSRGVISQMIMKTLAGTAAAVGAAAVLGSVASGSVKSPWYVALDKLAIQPPGPVFPIVWTLLYSDIAISSAVVIDRLQVADPAALSPISARLP